MIEKLIITHQEPIEGIKVWILHGYPCNILGFPSKYCNYTSMDMKQFGCLCNMNV